jgi:hypothetical protein
VRHIVRAERYGLVGTQPSSLNVTLM